MFVSHIEIGYFILSQGMDMPKGKVKLNEGTYHIYDIFSCLHTEGKRERKPHYLRNLKNKVIIQVQRR